MKKLLVLSCLIFLLSMGMDAHPLHLSIINITIDGRVFSISIKTFVDDWETAYFHYFSKPIELSRKENYKNEWFIGSIKDSWQIRESLNDKPPELFLDTIVFVDQTMTLEMHGEFPNNPKSLYIYNSILTDIFPDQTNLVIISVGNKETGMKFDYKKRLEELKLK